MLGEDDELLPGGRLWLRDCAVRRRRLGFRNFPGQGDLPVLDFMRALKTTGYDGALDTLELACVRAGYAEYGAWIILLKGLTPIPYKLVTITSGFANYNIWLFVALSVSMTTALLVALTCSSTASSLSGSRSLNSTYFG